MLLCLGSSAVDLLSTSYSATASAAETNTSAAAQDTATNATQLHRKVSSVTGAVVTMSPMCISPTLDSASSPSISPSLLAQQTAILDPCPGVAAGLGEKFLPASQLVSALFDAAVHLANDVDPKIAKRFVDQNFVLAYGSLFFI